MDEEARVNPAIVYEPDGYRTDGERLMGRQAAGRGFLRAAVAAAAGRTLTGYTPTQKSAESFARTVAEIDPAAKTQWLQPGRYDQLTSIGHLYVPGPALGDAARQRLRASPSAWSITGVTHTTASHGAMDSIADLLTQPVMPWDALICTSTAVLATVRTVLDQQRDYLRWRFGSALAAAEPQLPVIPLGVHCDDFRIAPQEKLQAREALGIAADEVVALFVGRLSYHAKAHPHAMYAALQAVAQKSGRKVTLVQCGWFANDAIEGVFRESAKSACPEVRCLFTDGRSAASLRQSWACADFFVSLSDNIQETFGLSPIEAMAAGLPVVVTDWDGYKDTVRDGVDGFRVSTWMPGAGAGEGLARAYELGLESYDAYCGLSSQYVALDHRALAESIEALVTNTDLRKRMGDAGRQRAREMLDWAVVYRRYQDLWRELERIRPSASATVESPRAAPSRLDPFSTFGHYATQKIAGTTRVRARGQASPVAYAAMRKQPLFSYAQRVLPSPDGVAKMWPLLAAGASVSAVAQAMGAPEGEAARAVAALAKMGLVELAPAAAQ